MDMVLQARISAARVPGGRDADAVVPGRGWAAIGYGAIAGLVFAPPDYQQGDAFRIIYVHAPSGWISMFAYSTMAVAGAIGLIWRMKMGYAVAAAVAPIGASFTLLALVTGSLWGRPMWGTYWAWDPRLTSELILLFLYVGVMSLRPAFEDGARRSGGGAAVNRGRGERAHHPLFGSVVELAASGCHGC